MNRKQRVAMVSFPFFGRMSNTFPTLTADMYVYMYFFETLKYSCMYVCCIMYIYLLSTAFSVTLAATPKYNNISVLRTGNS
jgi:hypothetical protein